MTKRNINWIFFLVFVVSFGSYLKVESKGVLSLSWIQNSGQFSWFYPKVDITSNEPAEIESTQGQATKQQKTKILDNLLDEDVNDLTEKLQRHFPFLEEEVSPSYDRNGLRYSIEKGLSSFHYWKGAKYRIVLTDDRSVIISQKLWPLGWRHYPFKIHVQVQNNSEKNQSFTVDFIPLHNLRSMQQFLLRLHLRSDQGRQKSSKRTLLTSEIYHSKRIPSSHLKSIFEPLIYHLTKLFQEKSRLYLIRRLQQEEYDQASHSAEEKRMKLELDKIIHPEKYKTKLPIIRDSSSRGSGRYVPSAATQARRQVRSGG